MTICRWSGRQRNKTNLRFSGFLSTTLSLQIFSFVFVCFSPSLQIFGPPLLSLRDPLSNKDITLLHSFPLSFRLSLSLIHCFLALVLIRLVSLLLSLTMLVLTKLFLSCCISLCVFLIPLVFSSSSSRGALSFFTHLSLSLPSCPQCLSLSLCVFPVAFKR